jgi:ribosome-binding protein aMBF1 (putative translation factor)
MLSQCQKCLLYRNQTKTEHIVTDDILTCTVCGNVKLNPAQEQREYKPDEKVWSELADRIANERRYEGMRNNFIIYK